MQRNCVARLIVSSWLGELKPVKYLQLTRLQIPTVSAYALNHGHHLSLDSRTAIVPYIVGSYEDINRSELGEHDPSLVYNVYTLPREL
jgi:hypothetical protein